MTTWSIALVGAVIVAVLVWLVANAAGAELTVDQGAGPQDVTLVAVILTSVIVPLLGWGLLALLERFTARAKTLWTAVAVVVLLLSMIPLAFVDATNGTKVALALMHLTVGAIVIVGFRRGARSA